MLAGLKYNQHDLRLMARQYNREKLLIYNDDTTDDIYFELEQEMPDLAGHYLDLLNEIAFNQIDTISDEIYGLFKSHVAWNEKCQLISKDINEKIITELIDESENAEMYRQYLQKMKSKKKMSKKEIFEEIKLLQNKYNDINDPMNQRFVSDSMRSDNGNVGDNEDDDDDDDWTDGGEYSTIEEYQRNVGVDVMDCQLDMNLPGIDLSDRL